ncbi:SHOCT domain-containing protein [Aliiruegeria lutimaris]|uniref:Short C-terminal domain-containing protein n=1 Tax=Aliiruegeria lutimaris TaxID=571298 RepID=A0A1G8SMC4_9RHOB|nr:SHOCT domain-containing protein [Aliiruegeria lutimaris]SDJ30351.1 Short C-terminal domain-containing protein [Aliiruegeria lutimaris]
MSHLSPEGQAVVNDVSVRHGFSPDAVTHVLIALDQGGGSQAQFNHFELGGMGQWSIGGMTMIGDMFNNGLKARVDGLCSELSNALMNTQVFQPPAPQPVSYQGQSQSSGGMQMQGSGGMGQSSLFVPGPGSSNWWPQDLGQPGSTGAQNDLRYAYFPMMSRLAIQQGGHVTVYDTGQHQIGGFGQQQSGDQSLTFTSQFGLVRVADLPVVPMGGAAPAANPEPTPAEMPASVVEPAQPVTSAPAVDSNAIFDSLEKLGQLRDRGILTDAEFDQKKMELLSRL